MRERQAVTVSFLSLALCVGLLLAALYIPPLAGVLKMENPGTRGWGLVIVMSLIPWAVGLIVGSLGLGWKVLQPRKLKLSGTR